jgi:hypothetical protein
MRAYHAYAPDQAFLLPVSLIEAIDARDPVHAVRHTRTGDAALIAGHLGSSDAFDRAITQLAASYADTNERDHAQLQTAIRAGRINADLSIVR